MIHTKTDCIHHSRLPFYRDPPGAMPSGGILTIRVKLKKGWGRKCGESVHILFSGELGDHSIVQDLLCQDAPGDYFVYEGKISMPEGVTGLLRYYFVLNDGDGLHYYLGESGEGELAAADDGRRYQITLFDGDFRTPEWPRQGVMYHVFVDRFARGEGEGGLARADYHRRLGRHIHAHADWYETPLYTPHDGAASYHPDDFYGGDLEGIRKKLPYLADLGVTGLYLSPIFESPSNHKYDTSDYRKVDPMFGTEEDFLCLCTEAEALGIRIMLDGVFSHTGDDSLYFNRRGNYPTLGAYQSANSPYYPWYRFTEYPREYDSWWGFETLPNVNEMEAGYRDFMLGEDGVISHWLKKGASGWRLDVADELPDAFIQDMRRAVKATGEENLLLGEVWEDASNKEAYGEQKAYVLGDELDAVMNYPMRDAIFDFLLQETEGREAATRLAVLQENYPPVFYYSCLNMLSSHDVPRALSLLGGGPDKDAGWSREEQGGFSLSAEGRALALKRFPLAALLQMGLPGCPCIYYGDEAGMEGLMDPLNRGTYPWGGEDKTLQAQIRKLVHLRRDHPVLQTGGCHLLAPHPDVMGTLRFVQDGVDAFGNPCENGTYILLVNRAEEERKVTLSLGPEEIEGKEAHRFAEANGQYRDLLTGAGAYTCEGNAMELVMPALSGLLLRRED